MESIFKFLNLKQKCIFIPVYEGEDDAAVVAAAAAAADKVAADKVAADKVAADAAADRKFTQTDMDRAVQSRLARHEKDSTALAKKAEELAERVQMSDKDRSELQTQLEEVQNAFKSSEQIAREQQEKAKNEHDVALAKEQESTKQYKILYETNLISQGINEAMVEFEALIGPAIPSILGTMTSVKETVGEDGKPTGQFAPIVSFPDVNENGNPVKLELSVRDAIKRMSETPEKYGNLFKGSGSGGVGSTNAGGARPQTQDLKAMSPEEYRKRRKDGTLAHQRGS